MNIKCFSISKQILSQYTISKITDTRKANNDVNAHDEDEMKETNNENNEPLKPTSPPRMTIISPLKITSETVRNNKHNISHDLKLKNQKINVMDSRTLSSIENQMNRTNKITSNISSKVADTGKEKAYICPVNGCDEIKLDKDLMSGADIDHMVNCHGWDKAAVGSFESTWQLVAICTFKSNATVRR